ncbi:hypothetical protein GCM10022408_28540 [Hymenobacter fastidiosus]|uniref:Uncharacterized protein n=2 Tax=Hymenobacter fastidiosus TaxID=486264 RepID=A0ABP7SM86_9BACT
MNTSTHIKNLLEVNSLANYHTMHSIPRTCSKSTVTVLDYDYIKDAYCRGMRTIKSADCLHLNTGDNVISFIEMKDISKFIQFTQEKSKDANDFNLKFKVYKNELKNGLKDKIMDSIAMLISTMGYYSCDSTIIKNILSKDNTKINYIIIVKMTASEYLDHSLSTLSTDLNFRILHGGEATIVRAATFDKSPCL